MAKKLDVYIDICSIYSFLIFEDVLRNLEQLASHGVQVDFHPVLLGAINKGSGNQPPWLLPSKAAYLSRDTVRSLARVGVPPHRPPANLMPHVNTASPLRALHYIKTHFPDMYLDAIGLLFRAFWLRGAYDINDKDARTLSNILREKFSEEEEQVQRIIAGREGCGGALRERTAEALQRGAFGLPWVWASHGDKEEAFFGSDRMNHIYEFLKVPFQDVKVLPRL